MPASKIAFFVTPHGFGHASRSAAVMEALGRRDPEIEFEIVTTVPEWFFAQSLSVSHRVRPVTSDVGLVQVDPVLEDLPATVAALEVFWSALGDTAHELVHGWRSAPPRLVVSDISPLGLEVASRLGVPSVLVENFTWDWIYRVYVDAAPALGEFARRSADLTATATHHIQCEPACRRVDTATQVGPVSRTALTTRAKTRRAVGLDDNDPRALVLLTMGGMGWGSLVPDLGEEVFLVALGGASELSREDSILWLPDRSPLYPPDLVWAADAVISKLGYSTVAECFGASTRLGYVTRPIFPESPVLERFVVENMTSAEFRPSDLEASDWSREIEQLLALPRAPEQESSGAEEIADLLLDLLE